MQHVQFISGAIDAGGCVSNAWDLLKQKYGTYLGIGLIAMLLTGCVPCLNIFIMGPVMGGVFFVVLRDMRGEPIDFGMMFKGFEKFVPLMVIGLIQSIPGVIFQVVRFSIDLGQLGLSGKDGDFQFFQAADRSGILAGGLALFAVIVGLVFMLLALVWWMVMFFAIPLAMEHDLGPMEAIKLSARASTNNIGGLVLLLVFQIFIMLAGVLMLCVGAFLFSLPLIYIANAFAYRQVFPFIDRPMNVTPPPPGAYGTGFGQGM